MFSDDLHRRSTYTISTDVSYGAWFPYKRILTKEVSNMIKHTITKWWMWGLVAMIPGAILIPASALALVAHLETITPGNWNNFVPDDYSRAMVFLIVLGGIFGVVGIIAQFVAWIGTVLNTHRLADKTWFNILLWVGIVGIVTIPLFGLGVFISGSMMIAYLVGRPDGMAPKPPLETAAVMRPTMLAKQTIKKWSNWAIVAMVSGTLFSLLVANLTNPGRFLHGLVWPSLALESLGFTAVGCGVIAVTVAWWAAVFNTHRLLDKTWFKLLLWSGIIAVVISPLFGIGLLIGLGVMIAYLIAGPDGMTVQESQIATSAEPPKTLVPTG